MPACFKMLERRLVLFKKNLIENINFFALQALQRSGCTYFTLEGTSSCLFVYEMSTSSTIFNNFSIFT